MPVERLLAHPTLFEGSVIPELRELLDVLSAVKFEFGETSFSVAGIIKGVVILFFALYVCMGLARFVEDMLEGMGNPSPSPRVLLAKISRIILIIVALLAAFLSLSLAPTPFCWFS